MLIFFYLFICFQFGITMKFLYCLKPIRRWKMRIHLKRTIQKIQKGIGTLIIFQFFNFVFFSNRDEIGTSLSTPSPLTNGTNHTGNYYLNIVKPLSNLTRDAGETVRLKCEFSGNPIPKVSWFKHEAPIEPEKGKIQIKFSRMRDHQDRVRARLIINRLDTHDIGYYRCEASNGYKTIDSIGVLMVKAGMLIV